VQGLRTHAPHRQAPAAPLAETIFAAAAPPETPAAAPDPAAAAADGPGAAVHMPGLTAFESAAESKELPAFGAPQKVRFGLFGKTLIVMLLISLLPFVIFWFLTFRETSDRMRSDSEALLAQTAKGLADQMDGWVNANFGVLRTAAKLPDILSMNRDQQEATLKAISREYPWMYLVFTVAPTGMNVAAAMVSPCELRRPPVYQRHRGRQKPSAGRP